MEINAEKALLLINQGELLFIVQNNKKTYFAKKKEKIYVQSNAYSYLLDSDTFLSLYKNVSFYIEDTSDISIDSEIDKAYYSLQKWKY